MHKDLRFPHYKHLRQLYKQIYEQMVKEPPKKVFKRPNLKSISRLSPDLPSEVPPPKERFRSVRMSLKKGI